MLALGYSLSLLRMPFFAYGSLPVGQWRSSCRMELIWQKQHRRHQQKQIGNSSERKYGEKNTHDSSAETSVGTPSYKTHMKLTIFSVSMADYGMYKCVAKNPRGETDGTIRLYGKFKTKIYYTYLWYGWNTGRVGYTCVDSRRLAFVCIHVWMTDAVCGRIQQISQRRVSASTGTVSQSSKLVAFDRENWWQHSMKMHSAHGRTECLLLIHAYIYNVMIFLYHSFFVALCVGYCFLVTRADCLPEFFRIFVKNFICARDGIGVCAHCSTFIKTCRIHQANSRG